MISIIKSANKNQIGPIVKKKCVSKVGNLCSKIRLFSMFHTFQKYSKK